MSRWRAPSKKSSPYITKEGAKALREELQYLWKVERPKVTDVVHEAAKNGDRSENGDYIYGKRRLREIDSRIRFLTRRLDDVIVVDQVPEDKSKIYFGAWVGLEDEKGSEVRYRIVGADEFNLRENKISVDSPLARALIGKSLDSEVAFNSPDGLKIYFVTEVEYLGELG